MKTQSDSQSKNEMNPYKINVPENQASGNNIKKQKFYGLMPIIYLSIGMIVFLVIVKLIMDLFLVK